MPEFVRSSEERPLELSQRVGRLVCGVTSFVAVGALGAAQGGYFPTSWGWAAAGLSWVMAVALIVVRPIRLSRLELVTVGAYAGLVGWIALSVAWSRDGSRSVLEVERVLIYVVGLAAFLVTTRRRSVPHLLGGVLAAISLVGCYALATRLIPGRVGSFDSVAVYRLATPLGYWNALGIFSVLGVLLAVGFVRWGKSIVVRALAAAATIVLAETL